jgi:intracellular septation protein
MFTKRLLINSFCEFGPILFFFLAYSVASFSAGIVAMMFGTALSLAVLRFYDHTLPYFALFSSGSVLFFGGLALLVDTPSIFIFRDTILDVALGIALIISVHKKRPLFKYVLKGVFAITDKGWSVLSLRWGYFFLCLALVNETIRLTLSDDAWVVAKALIVVASIVFGTYQFTLTRKERLPTGTAWGIVK